MRNGFTFVKRLRGFNEAGGFLPRKRQSRSAGRTCMAKGFNEAGGFLPRKQALACLSYEPVIRCFNEAGGFLPRKRFQAGYEGHR